MSDNWVVQNLENALDTWNEKLAEIWQLITNKTPEEVQEIMAALTKLEEKNTKAVRGCLDSYGADYIPIIVDGGRNSDMPQFNDFEIDLDKKEITVMQHLSPVQQAEGIINRLESAKTAFTDDERSLIVNYAHKLNDMEKTRELAEHIYMRKQRVIREPPLRSLTHRRRLTPSPTR